MFVPLTTFTALTGYRFVDNFIVKAAAGSTSEPLKKSLIAVLAKKHRFSPADKEAVAMWDTTDNLKFLNTFMGGFRTFLAIVGTMTLVVGGIGVSNIMNVVVEERTREIGIKMALGAPPASIRRQFLLETLVITFLGGLAGIVLAAAICAAFPASFEEYVGKPVISPLLAGLVALVLGLIGLLAGYYPAREASRLDPVAAMKV
jgi:putative ABC transport system permease protein